jgi:hypothetical protein
VLEPSRAQLPLRHSLWQGRHRLHHLRQGAPSAAAHARSRIATPMHVYSAARLTTPTLPCRRASSGTHRHARLRAVCLLSVLLHLQGPLRAQGPAHLVARLLLPGRLLDLMCAHPRRAFPPARAASPAACDASLLAPTLSGSRVLVRVAVRYWSVWFPVETLMWVVVPAHLRVAFMCSVSLVWQVALSTLSNRQPTSELTANAQR